MNLHQNSANLTLNIVHFGAKLSQIASIKDAISAKKILNRDFLQLYIIPLQKIGANTVSDIRIKVLELKCPNV